MPDKTIPIITEEYKSGQFKIRYDLFAVVLVRGDSFISTYDIVVTEFYGGKSNTALLADISEDYSEAKAALEKLRENGISPRHCADLAEYFL